MSTRSAWLMRCVRVQRPTGASDLGTMLLSLAVKSKEDEEAMLMYHDCCYIELVKW